MRNKLFVFKLFLLCFKLFGQNPITPEGIYIADPAAHVWSDGRLYVYGSVDLYVDQYCSTTYHVLSTDNMRDWQLHKDVFSSVGDNDQVPYSDYRLSAPDCYEKDGKFYMYYCQHVKPESEGVAISDSPTGPFIYSNVLNVGKHQQIDPNAFIDDDGQAYYVWGQFDMKIAKLKPNMTELDKTSIISDALTEEEHFFHEGAFMTKRNDLYYIVYAHLSKTGCPTELGYATSSQPMGPYTYGGVIIDNAFSDPGVWNNHGSIAEFNGQWYVFYHRSSHNSEYMRTSCVEPIYFNKDGSIDEVEMTSQGAGAPLNARSKLDAYRLCNLKGQARLQLINDSNVVLTRINNKDRAVFKYVDFGDGVSELSVRVKLASSSGSISIGLDQAWTGGSLLTVDIPAAQGEKQWVNITVPIEHTVVGKHALWLSFNGKDEVLFDFDWLMFK